MKTIVAVPCMDQVQTTFVQSLLELKRPGEVKFAFIMGSLIYDARNTLALRAIQEDSDYVLWLDSDMVFKPDLLERMLADDKDIVSGLFFRRRPPFSPCLYKTLRADRDDPHKNAHELLKDYPRDELFEVEGVGLAAVLVKTDVLRAIALREGTIFAPLLGYGEDLSFCIRARDAGYSVWCDSRIKVGHTASMVVDESTYNAMAEAAR